MKTINKNSTKAEVLEAVKQDGYWLQYASEELRGDKEVVLAAVSQNGWALQFASKELMADREFMMKAVRRYGWALEHASDELRCEILACWVNAIKQETKND